MDIKGEQMILNQIAVVTIIAFLAIVFIYALKKYIKQEYTIKSKKPNITNKDAVKPDFTPPPQRTGFTCKEMFDGFKRLSEIMNNPRGHSISSLPEVTNRPSMPECKSPRKENEVKQTLEEIQNKYNMKEYRFYYYEELTKEWIERETTTKL